MSIKIGGLLILLVTFFGAGIIQAQDIEIKLGPGEIGENQAFTVSIVAKNSSIKSYDKFPDIPGLRKRGTSSSSSTNIVNGRVSSSHSIIMTYTPSGQGIIEIKPFSITVNGDVINSPGKILKIGPAVQQQQRRDPFNHDPFQDFFGQREQPQEFIDIKDDAFLALTTDKKEVYVGEGFTATLAFYVAESNRAPLQFYDLGRQLGEILKTIKPANCWEENFNIEQINGQPISINGKAFTQYKIYQGAFYPLNNEAINFPSVGLELIKYKVAKNPTFFGQNRKESFKTFKSKSQTVRVKDLPPHPLKDAVAVGHFKLQEKIDKTSLNTGQSFSYEFSLYGEGNVAAVTAPTIIDQSDIEFYPPNVQQSLNRSGGRVTGAKSFQYFGIPNEPGTYHLKDYFQWVYFNTRKQDYDTLTSNVVLTVTGESRKNETIIANDLGAFYNLIEVEDNGLIKQNDWATIKIVANVFILLTLAVSAFVLFKK